MKASRYMRISPELSFLNGHPSIPAAFGVHFSSFSATAINKLSHYGVHRTNTATVNIGYEDSCILKVSLETECVQPDAM